MMQEPNLYEMDVEDFSSDVPTDQLPSVEEVRTQAQMMMNRSTTSSSLGGSKKMWKIGAVALAMVLLIVAIAVPVSNKTPDGNDPISKNVGRSVHKIALNGKSDFTNENSYHSIAKRWLEDDSWLKEQDYTYNQLQQRYALYCLHHATGGKSWVDGTGWHRKGISECHWYGVTCDASTGLVTRVSLRNNGLNGTIPPEVALIPSLTVFNVNSNPALKGSIPDHVCRLADNERQLEVKVDCETVECSCCAACQD